MKPDELKIKSEERLPGASIDVADDEQVKASIEKERTKTLDDNPRDNNLD